MRSLRAISPACVGLAMLSGALFSGGTALAAPAAACVSSAPELPVCVSQQPNLVTITINISSGSASPVAAPPVTPLVTDAQLAAPPVTPVATDPRTTTYAQRQSLRDQFRGQIDELTFNDELGDGVSLYQALSEAMAARLTSRKGTMP